VKFPARFDIRISAIFTPDRPFLLANRYKQNVYPVWNLLKQLDTEGKLVTPAQKLLTAPTMPAEKLYDTFKDPQPRPMTINVSRRRRIAAAQREELEQEIEALEKEARAREEEIDELVGCSPF